MYSVSFSILGFDEIKSVSINKIDEIISTMILNEEDNTQLQMINIDYLDNLDLNFVIEHQTLDELKLTKREDVNIYFPIVIQNPIENSVVNLFAPILINEKEKLLGQYVIKTGIPKPFITVKEASKQ